MCDDVKLKVPNMDKHMLFFNNATKGVVEYIIKMYVRDKFVLVNVDTTSVQIPRVVTSVPMIITFNKNVYVEENIIKFVEMLANSSKSSIGQKEPNNTSFYESQQPANELVSYTSMEMSGTLSDQYSFIEDGGSYAHNFVNIGGGDPVITKIQESDTETIKNMKFDQKMYENYVNQRNIDIQRIERTNMPQHLLDPRR